MLKQVQHDGKHVLPAFLQTAVHAWLSAMFTSPYSSDQSVFCTSVKRAFGKHRHTINFINFPSKGKWAETL
jgi:hypothetical protein